MYRGIGSRLTYHKDKIAFGGDKRSHEYLDIPSRTTQFQSGYYYSYATTSLLFRSISFHASLVTCEGGGLCRIEGISPNVTFHREVIKFDLSCERTARVISASAETVDLGEGTTPRNEKILRSSRGVTLLPFYGQ